GIETQFVFEKKLREQGKSRLDFKREELYEMIKNYVNENRGGIEKQLRRLGFSLDWSREKYTLDNNVIEIVYDTFKKLFADGLAYRAKRLVNYCTFDGTSFSDLEVVHEERKSLLYYIKYGPLVLATTRPETKFGDTAVAVHPNDKRYKKYVGQELEIETVLGKTKIKVIADESVDPEFGTGVVKITPAHDFNDFETGKRHKLPLKQVIGFDGKMNHYAGKFAGLYVKQARKAIVEEMQAKGLIEKIDENYQNRVGLCYKCRNILEPLPLEQWFVRMEPLAKPAIEAVKSKKIKIYPKGFEKRYFQFLENIRDWNISRQIVWGISIPAWFREWKPTKDIVIMGFHQRTEPQVLSGKTKTYRLRDHDFKVGDKFAFENSQTKKIFGYGTIIDIERTVVGKIPLDDRAHGATYKERKELIEAFKFHKPELGVTEKTKAWIYAYSFGFLREGQVHEIYVGEKKPIGEGWIQDKDTFDTWFSSAQWPFSTLMTNCDCKGSGGFFDKFYPTSVMETGYDILPWWVARMAMVGIYRTGKIPFKNILLHGLVNDPLGKKMSKSKGNVVNPLEIVNQYGADAVRFALIYGNATGNDQSLSYPKLEAARKFTNKLWNMARFIEMQKSKIKNQKLENNLTMEQLENIAKHEKDKEMVKKIGELTEKVTEDLEKYNFNYAAEALYESAWHEFADKYIEDVKNRINENSFLILNSSFLILLKLLHPFMPFVTEEIYQRFKFGKSIMIDRWPSFAKASEGKPSL
ncbi:MAG: Valine-tRNA ligase, partial [Candidatus Levybacteria bacterium GW2011_GWA1_37_16]